MKFSKFITYFFHPINFPFIGSLLYFIFIPKFIFKPLEYLMLLVIFIGTYIFPLVLTYLLKRFEMISSYHMVSIEERKFPTLLFIGISYIIGNWLYKSNSVDLLALFFFGYGVILIIIYLLLHVKLKMSLHTAAIGGLIGFLIYFSYFFKVNLILIMAILFIIGGLIASSRVKLNAHKLSEVIFGFLIGLISQFLVFYIYIM